ncbi:MAG TPA: preprotein translocase subunit SecY, partial [Spirochaetia bacterium]|nr:preprotein translocase subunit SecY [Spirochaetia bacterium]
MVEAFKNVFKIPELRTRIFFTLGALIVFRIGAHIAVPGIDMVALQDFFKDLVSKQQGSGGNAFMDFVSLFTGGALTRFAIFGLGVMPYISSSIIMQLLQVVLPPLEKLAKEGDYGRRKINLYTRYLSIGLAVVEGIGMLIYFNTSVWNQAHYVAPLKESSPFMFSFLFIATLTSGTMFLLWLGEQITERGIGNGVSLLIFAGIVARVPSVIQESVVTGTGEQGYIIKMILLVIIFIALIALVTFIQQGERRVTVKYAKRVVGNKMYQGQNTFIPFKVDGSGVIAIIFASSVVLFPSQLLGTFGGDSDLLRKIANLLSPGPLPGSLLYYFIYLFLVVFFCYFYTAVIYNPNEIAEHVRKNGGFIPGIRPGEQTGLFLQKMLN